MAIFFGPENRINMAWLTGEQERFEFYVTKDSFGFKTKQTKLILLVLSLSRAFLSS